MTDEKENKCCDNNRFYKYVYDGDHNTYFFMAISDEKSQQDRQAAINNIKNNIDGDIKNFGEKKNKMESLLDIRKHIIQLKMIINFYIGKEESFLNQKEELENYIREKEAKLNELEGEIISSSEVLIPSKKVIEKFMDYDRHYFDSKTNTNKNLTSALIYDCLLKINKITDKTEKNKKLRELYDNLPGNKNTKEILINNLLKGIGTDTSITFDSFKQKIKNASSCNKEIGLKFLNIINSPDKIAEQDFNGIIESIKYINNNYLKKVTGKQTIQELEKKIYGENLAFLQEDNCRNFIAKIPLKNFDNNKFINAEFKDKTDEEITYLGTFFYNEILKKIGLNEQEVNEEYRQKLKQIIYYIISKQIHLNASNGEVATNIKNLISNIILEIGNDNKLSIDNNYISEIIPFIEDLGLTIKDDFISTQERENLDLNALGINETTDIKYYETKDILNGKNSDTHIVNKNDNHFILFIKNSETVHKFDSIENRTWTQNLCYYFAIEENYAIQHFMKLVGDDKIETLLNNIQNLKFDENAKNYYKNNEQKIRNCIAVMKLYKEGEPIYDSAKNKLIEIIENSPFYEAAKNIAIELKPEIESIEQQQIEAKKKPEEPKEQKNSEKQESKKQESKTEELKKKVETVEEREQELKKYDNFFSYNKETAIKDRQKIVENIDNEISKEDNKEKISDFEKSKRIGFAIANHIVEESGDDFSKFLKLIPDFSVKSRTAYIAIRKAIVDNTERMKFKIDDKTDVKQDIIFPAFNALNYFEKGGYLRTKYLLLDNLINVSIPNAIKLATDEQKKELNAFLEILKEIKEKNPFNEISEEERKQKKEKILIERRENLKKEIEEINKKWETNKKNESNKETEKDDSKEREKQTNYTPVLEQIPFFLRVFNFKDNEKQKENIKRINEAKEIMRYSKTTENIGKFLKFVTEKKEKDNSKVRVY